MRASKPEMKKLHEEPEGLRAYKYAHGYNDALADMLAWHEQEITKIIKSLKTIQRYVAYDLPEEYICAEDLDDVIKKIAQRAKGEKNE